MATVALTARQAPPPTVAEFAPQAVEQIEEALPEQADAPGPPQGGAGGSGEPEAEASEEATDGPAEEVAEEAVIEVARVRACVGDPPRQTEDPQSPPCANYFDGDNGGATWQGVTEDEIRIAFPNAFFGHTADTIRALEDHFNQRYEFYGRKLVLLGYNPTDGTFAHPNPASMIADAVKVDEEMRAFASLGYLDRKGSEFHYYDELARRGVISVAGRLVNNGTEARMQQFAPYQWNVMPPIEVAMSLVGSAVCQTLAPHPPDGGGPTIQSAPERVFGLIVNTAADGTAPPFDVLVGRLSSCGVELAAFHDDPTASPDTTGAVLRMRDAGVTSVICLCPPDTAREGYTQAATQQLYFPEWVMSSYLNMDLDNSYHGTLPEQQENVLGVTIWNRRLPRQQMPWWWAWKEQRPDEDPAGGTYYDSAARYAQLLLLASGIQLAGPELTPENFERGLHEARFPNPGAGGPPYFQARVGFEGGRHTMIADASLFWYSATEGGTVDPAVPGAVCFVRGGLRYPVGGFPSGPEPFFDGPCS